MAVKNIVLPIPLTSTSAVFFDGTYKLINTAGLPEACFMIRIINDCNRDVTVSYDGVNDHDFVPTDTSIQLNFQTNSQPNNFIAKLAAGTKIYVKGVAGIGNVLLAGYYQPQQ